MSATTKSRVRWTLPVLLWIWAICIFLTLDLFLNLSGLDGIRPRANLYRGMRVAAHRMVGEPIHDGGFGAAGVRSGRDQQFDSAHVLADELVSIRELEDFGALQERALLAEDCRVRIAALRALALQFGPDARAALLETVQNGEESLKVRRQAARFLGWTGLGAGGELERILASEYPARVRAGALLGLGELGTEYAIERVLSSTAETSVPLRAAATEALAVIKNPEAAPLLRVAVLDSERRPETRIAICRSLGRMDDPSTARVLADVLADRTAPAKLRAMAASSLGRLARHGELTTVTAATTGEPPEVTREARIAQSRLLHRSDG